ncbi:D-proline reductase proprdA domain protein [[Clostridium] bifermentans ATCC 19299]|nr:D-proline reductase proprdA domain protein [[Clostridium] bifermentans ATCC 19299] [Paraclostridium bifermentans ATCC 19299]
MSITVETAKAHAKDPAVCCCRFEAGTVLEPSNLEDPAIFADLEDSGLLTIADDCLTIEQVLGAKLLKTLDALTPITADCVEGVVAVAEEAKEEVKEEVKEVAPVASVAPVSQIAPVNGQTIKIHIGEGRDINLEIPLNVAQGMGVAPVAPVAVAENAEAVEVKAEPVQEAKAIRSLTKNILK